MSFYTRAGRQILGNRAVRRIKARRLLLSQFLGIGRWSHPGLSGLDERLADYVRDIEGGVFIEFGANDGLQQSNTYLLEREFGWRGVLIEPVPELASECVRNRPLAVVVCGVVAAPQDCGSPVGISDQDLLSSTGLSRVMTAATTISLIIDNALSGRAPDLMSIDVEGYELSALAGLDLERHRPTWMLIETAVPAEVTGLLSGYYEQVAVLSHHDYLFHVRTSPILG